MLKIPFGKYKDKDVDDVPSDYLRWAVLQDFFEEKYPELLKEAEEELAYRDTWNRHVYED